MAVLRCLLSRLFGLGTAALAEPDSSNYRRVFEQTDPGNSSTLQTWPGSKGQRFGATKESHFASTDLLLHLPCHCREPHALLGVCLGGVLGRIAMAYCGALLSC